MPTTPADIFKQAPNLKEEDRAALAGLLIESLEEEPAEDIELIWKEEISRWMPELDSGEVEAIP